MSKDIPKELIELSHAIEAAGMFTSVQPLGDLPNRHRVVCASHKREDGALGGNSFWFTIGKHGWLLSTWENYVYRLPTDTIIEKLCEVCIALSDRPICTVPNDVIQKYGLESVDEDDWDDY